MNRIITLCYRKIIDTASTKPWDKLVFEDTYAEFRMQAQYFNQQGQYRTFGQLLQHAPGAEKLHFLVSAAVRGYLPQLQGLVPDVTDNLGRHFLKFSRFQFEIINSDLADKFRHQVAINFYSDPLVWHETIGTHLLVSEQALTAAGQEVPTHLVQLQPFLSIHALHPAA
ncbi:hypothetical protein [Hymenobacter sediminicola]|uniref:Uncharacterized protein n=1 Tax=Hymenobacter sediminicola TaxID=2761579 RepID=A0A7G7WBB3_9BACT|nr:hypothetical protein [Hymenobacter sediminicola]QNH63656.1 hypothetical protein H4317_07630 [Hymenobacter sediminicola]